MAFSKETLDRPEAKNPAALERIGLAKVRIQSILDREVVSTIRTLEKKISDQGPTPQRVDPHLITIALRDLQALNRLRVLKHPETEPDWYANPGTPKGTYQPRLEELATSYAAITERNMRNLIGDALEIVVQKCLEEVEANSARFSFEGHFDLDNGKNKHGRYKKTEPRNQIRKRSTKKVADFLQYGHDNGILCIECKNYREWIYPTNSAINNLIIKSYELGITPVLIARKLHYTTKTNFFEPAGIIAHETLHQYYPPEYSDLADKVRHKGMLGFTDIRASETPEARTVKFFSHDLPEIAPVMSSRWKRHKDDLYRYAKNEINLAQLYTQIGSPAGGKWQEPEDRGAY